MQYLYIGGAMKYAGRQNKTKCLNINQKVYNKYLEKFILSTKILNLNDNFSSFFH